MKRFEFPMDRVLKVKTQLKRIAELEEVRTSQVATAARLAVDGLKSQQVQMADRLSGKLGQGVSPCQWANAFELSDNLCRQLTAAEQNARAAEQKHEVALAERNTVASEVEALSTLREQRLDAWKRERDANTQEQLNEVGLRQWMSAQAEAA